MKNITLKFSLTILASAILTACGSSGGSSSDNSAKNTAKPVQTETAKPTEQANPTPAETAKPAEQAKPMPTETVKPTEPAKPEPVETVKPAEKPKPTDSLTNSEIKPTKFDPHFSGVAHPRTGGMFSYLSISPKPWHLDNLRLENKTIPLVPKGSSGELIHLINRPNIHIADVGYKNVRWAYINQESLGNDYMLAYGINMTPESNIPSHGNVRYDGNGVHVHSKNNTDELNLVTVSKVTLNANFDKKEIYGEIKPHTDRDNGIFAPIQLAAKIEGNKFSGEFNNTKTQGAFYGNNADEIAGQYISESQTAPHTGVFAAKKK